jgi:hypothetical protein
MKVVIHIDQVILHGLPVTAAQLPMVRAALERELQTLFRGPGAGRRLRAGAAPKLVGGAVDYRAEKGPARLGCQAAGAVHAATMSRGLR